MLHFRLKIPNLLTDTDMHIQSWSLSLVATAPVRIVTLHSDKNPSTFA